MNEEEAIIELSRVRAGGQRHKRIYSYICDVCKEICWTHRTNRKCCSPKCAIAAKPGITDGAGNPRWKGGKYKNEQGYISLSGFWDHPYSHPTRGTILEHRLVMERHLGRHLTKNETVHHKNGIRDDNRLENLELWTRPQPYGQRVSDLVEWLVDNYRFEVESKLKIKDIVDRIVSDANRNQEIV